MKLKALIFDMDGTLVDSALDFDKMRAEIGIKDGSPILEYIEELDSPKEKKRALEIVHRHELEGVERATLFSGVEDFLSLLYERKIKTAIFTRNSRFVTDKTLEKFGLEVDLAFSRDDVCHQKPHPEGLLKICEHFGFSVDEAIYTGDYLFDLTCAKNAGMKSMLYDRRKIEDYHRHASYVFDDFHALMKDFDYVMKHKLGFSTAAT